MGLTRARKLKNARQTNAAKDVERVDRRASAAAGGRDQALAAVGAVDRSANN
jgi:hypothetical protein